MCKETLHQQTKLKILHHNCQNCNNVFIFFCFFIFISVSEKNSSVAMKVIYLWGDAMLKVFLGYMKK